MEAKKFAKYILSLAYSNIIHFIVLNHVYDTISGMGVSKIAHMLTAEGVKTPLEVKHQKTGLKVIILAQLV